MAHREAAARRILPKSGREAIDAEAVVVQACLGRIQDNLTKVAGARRKVTRVVPAPGISAPRDASTESVVHNDDVIDISHRTEMGSNLDEGAGDADEKALLVERSDAIVAQSALLRLMRVVSDITNDIERARAEADEATSRAATLEQRVQCLEQTVRTQAAQINQQNDPRDAFTKYREMWQEKFVKDQGILAVDLETRRNAIQQLLRKRQDNAAAKRLVRERRRVLRQRAEHEASNPNAEAEDREIEAMMKGFAPVPSSVIADAGPIGTLVAPTFQLKTLVSGSLHLSTRSAPFVSDAGAARAAAAERQALSPSNAGLSLLESLRRKPVRSAADSGAATPAANAGSATPAPQAIAAVGTGTAASPVILSEMTVADVAKEIGGVKADFVLDHVDLLLDGDARAYERAAARAELGGAGSATSDDDGDEHVEQGDTAAVDDTQKSRAPKPEVRADELVITRLLGTNQRTVSRMDASATYIGVLLSALKFAPSEYTVLVLDADALAGRRAALGRQAAAAGISSFWDEVAQCTCPSVTIVQCNPPFAGDGTIAASNGHDVPIRQAPMHLTLLQARSDARQTTIDAELARRREAEHGPRTESELATMRNRDVTRLVVGSYRGAVTVHRAQLPKVGGNPPLKASQHPGIVAALARGDVAGERVDLVNNGTVRAYASTMLPSCKVDALVQPFYDSHSPFFSTRDAPGQFVTIAFSKIAIAPTGYSFASTHPTSGGFYPRSWSIEGSLDGQQWELLREHRDDASVDHHSPVGTWAIQSRPGTYYSEFRIRHTGVNSVGTRHLDLCSFEVYGRAMFVRERRNIDQAHLPPVPSCHAPLGAYSPVRSDVSPSVLSDSAVLGASSRGAPPPLRRRADIRIPLFDELPPEPSAKGKGKPKPKSNAS
jgi:hypothetical protein